MALHPGHDVSDAVAEQLAIDDQTRRREEDPFCDRFATITDTCVVVHRSRFEVDLNRPPEQAICRQPADCWGLRVWRGTPPQPVVAAALHTYHFFYRALEVLLQGMAERHGHFVVLDLHSYNYRRRGPTGPPEPPELNPEINLGTGRIDRQRWAPVVERFLEALRGYDFFGRHLDVRENIRFFGGQLPAWVEQRFPGVGCALAVEVKKFFMDEWTGRPDIATLTQVRRAIAHGATEIGRAVRTS